MLVLSARVDGSAIARELGVSRFLRKPFNIDELIDAVLALHRERRRYD